MLDLITGGCTRARRIASASTAAAAVASASALRRHCLRRLHCADPDAVLGDHRLVPFDPIARPIRDDRPSWNRHDGPREGEDAPLPIQAASGDATKVEPARYAAHAIALARVRKSDPAPHLRVERRRKLAVDQRHVMTLRRAARRDRIRCRGLIALIGTAVAVAGLGTGAVLSHAGGLGSSMVRRRWRSNTWWQPFGKPASRSKPTGRTWSRAARPESEEARRRRRPDLGSRRDLPAQQQDQSSAP